MSKLFEYIKEQSIIKKFGFITGFVIIISVSAVSAIFQDEVVKLKEKFIAGMSEQNNDNNSNIAAVSTFIPTPENQADKTNIPKTDIPPTDKPVTDAPKTDKPDNDSQNLSNPTELRGHLTGEDSHEESYRPLISGKYRFDFDIDDVNKSYAFLMFDSKRTEIARTYSSDDGKTIELQEGENYEIQIKQNTDFAAYSINIHTPNKAETINSGTAKGNINFTDQQNIYYFTADKSAAYNFNFISNNVDNRFRISMYDSKNREIIDMYGSNEERNIELKKNQKYTLYITYSQGFGKYRIKINR